MPRGRKRGRSVDTGGSQEDQAGGGQGQGQQQRGVADFFDISDVIPGTSNQMPWRSTPAHQL